MLKFLENKKTYITAGVCAIGVFLYKLGYISEESLTWVLGLGGPLGFAFLRAGVAKSQQ